MKFIILLMSIFTASLCWSCTEINNIESKAFARVIQKTNSELDIAIFYPNKLENAELSSVTISYSKGKDFIFLVDSKSSNSKFGFSDIDMKKYSSSYIAVKSKELSDIAISISYSWPPASDGSFSLCGPTLYHKLTEIIDKV